ncbi:MAG: hypothetical protein NTU66_07775 [Elusimicrobia bacterium]|nr:hypothetical protein [Elusimicrobiota bacterium]
MKLKKNIVLSAILLLTVAGFVSASEITGDSLKETLGGVSIGGHIKMYMYDGTEGTHNGVKQQDNSSAGFGGHAFYLYVGKELESWLRLDSQLEYEYTASATPKLGSDITRGANTSAATDPLAKTTAIAQLFMTASLPHGIEMKVGSFNAMYSEYYARETWWSEQYHLNPGICSLIALHDTGIELNKNFEFTGVSLPVYLSLLNGQQVADNNNDKMTLLHVAPEFFHSALKIMGSYGVGKYDAADKYTATRTLIGAEYKIAQVRLSSEYSTLTSQDKIAVGKDAVNQGYYVQGMYVFNDMWRAGINNSHADNEAVATYREVWDTNTLLLDCFLTPSSSIIGQYTMAEGNRTNGSDKVKYNRFTLGWRTTF